MYGLSYILLAAVALVSLVDFLPRLFIKFSPATKLSKKVTRNQDFLILPTVYGNTSYIDKFSGSFLKRYGKRVLILTTDHESPEFYTKLRQLTKEYGVRFARVNMHAADNRRLATNAYTIYKQFFANYHARKLRNDTVCILIDADTYSKQSIRALVHTFNEQALDMASLRCEIANPQSTIEHLQAFEYKLAMDNRRTDTWLTSGACNMGRAQVYRQVFKRHSEFFAGGDIEIGKIAQVSGFKIRHIDFTFLTLAPDTFIDWYKQRIIWMAGGFRHHFINIGSFGWHHFFITFYSSFLVFLLYPLRWIELINYPLTLGIMILFSWLYIYLFIARKSWHPRLLLLPFYSFIQVMIILPVAIKRYASYAIKQKSLGMMHYDFSQYSVGSRIAFSSLNIATALALVGVATVFTIARLVRWYG